MKTARQLLRLVTEKWAPPDQCAHALTVTDGELKLMLWVAERNWKNINIDEVDLDKSPEQIIAEIEVLLGK